MFRMKDILLGFLLLGIVFAVPTGLSIVINGDAPATNSTAATLTLAAVNATNCSFSNDGSTYGAPFAYTTSKSWNLTSGDGLKTVYFKCMDNESNWSAPVTDTITLNTSTPDTTPPESSSKTPTGTITNRRPTISALLSDAGSGINSGSIVLKLDDVAVSHNYSSGVVSYVPAENLSFSSHAVQLSVSDNAGNPHNTSWSFTISSLGVGFGNYGPANNSFVGTSRPLVSVILVDSGSGINTSSLAMELDSIEVSDDANYVASTKNYSYNTPTLAKGNHSVLVRVQDLGGRESGWSWNFYIDTTVPYIGMVEPAHNSIVTSVSAITAKIEDDESGLDTDEMEMELNGVVVTSGTSYDDEDGILAFSPTVPLTAGTYTVEIWAKDKAGNEANKEWTFSVASSEPVLGSFSPEDGSTVSDNTPAISVVITDPGTSGIDTDSIRIFLDGREVTSNATYNAANGKVSYTPAAGLSDGEHDVEIRAANNNRESSTAEWSFTVDSTKPASCSNVKINQTDSGTYIYWSASTSSDIENYLVYGSGSSFTTLLSNKLLATLDSDATEYYDEGATGWRYYAIVAQDGVGNQAAPVFIGSCSIYGSGAWSDHECCWDSDCETGYYCESHTCRATDAIITEADAEHAINGAESVIERAREDGKNVTEAEDYLEDAQNAFNAGNYEQAEHFASLARNSALNARLIAGEEELEEEGGLACCPSAFILLAVLGIALSRK